MNIEPIALKEWAAVIKALESGEQILLMRKGGIAEETRDFQVESRTFYLFPTYEHQRSELLKPSWQTLVDDTRRDWDPDSPTVQLECCAEVVEELELGNEAELGRLYPYHIWTEAFAEERLRWKKDRPLHVLLLRVYKLNHPVTIPLLPAYSGCKSWIRLQDHPAGQPMTPVLEDRQFSELVRKVKNDIGR